MMRQEPVAAVPIPDLVFLANDDPEAEGRTPITGDSRYTLTFLLEGRRCLAIHCGPATLRHFRQMLAAMDVENALDQALRSVHPPACPDTQAYRCTAEACGWLGLRFECEARGTSPVPRHCPVCDAVVQPIPAGT